MVKRKYNATYISLSLAKNAKLSVKERFESVRIAFSVFLFQEKKGYNDDDAWIILVSNLETIKDRLKKMLKNYKLSSVVKINIGESFLSAMPIPDKFYWYYYPSKDGYYWKY